MIETNNDMKCFFIPFNNENRVTLSKNKPSTSNNTRLNDIWINNTSQNSIFYLYNGSNWRRIGNFTNQNINLTSNEPSNSEENDIWIDIGNINFPIYIRYDNTWNNIGRLNTNTITVNKNNPFEGINGDLWINTDGEYIVLSYYNNGEWNILGELAQNQFTISENEPIQTRDGNLWYRLNSDGTTSIITWINGDQVILGNLIDPDESINNESKIILTNNILSIDEDINEGDYAIVYPQMGEINKFEDDSWKYIGLVQNKLKANITNLDELWNAGFEIYDETVMGASFYIDPIRGLVMKTGNTFKTSIKPPIPGNPFINALTEFEYYGTPNLYLQLSNINTFIEGSNEKISPIFILPNKIPNTTVIGENGIYTTQPHLTSIINDKKLFYSLQDYKREFPHQQSVNNPPRTYRFISDSTSINAGSIYDTNISYLDLLKFGIMLLDSENNIPSEVTVNNYQQINNTIFLNGAKISTLYFFTGDDTGSRQLEEYKGSSEESVIKYLKYKIIDMEYEFIFGDKEQGMP